MFLSSYSLSGFRSSVGILFGLAPALKSSKTDLQASLKEGGRGSTSTHHRAQSSLVIVQMALTLVLLVGAGLLFRTIRQLVGGQSRLRHASTSSLSRWGFRLR